MKKPIACSDRMKVLSDPTRLAVLEQLLAGPRTVSGINAELRIEQSLLSHHLQVLRRAGLVATAREGRSVRYALAPGARPKARVRAIDLGCCRISFVAGPEKR